MNAPLPGSPSITGIKVDRTARDADMPRITFTWTDGAGEAQEVTRYARAAELIITDLHAATLLGENARQTYLVGFLRCHSLHRRGPD